MYTDFQNSFSVHFSGEFFFVYLPLTHPDCPRKGPQNGAVKWLWYKELLFHIKFVGTLSCEIRKSKILAISTASCLWDPEFISSDMWPPNRSDMNPVDCKVWRTMQLQSEKYLWCQQTEVVADWVLHGLQQTCYWQRYQCMAQCLQACVCAKGRHFQHLILFFGIFTMQMDCSNFQLPMSLSHAGTIEVIWAICITIFGILLHYHLYSVLCVKVKKS